MQRVTAVPSLPPRPADAHKGTCGTVVVVAGSEGMLGAAILATQGALRGGAGLVRAVVPRAWMPWLTLAAPSALTAAREDDAASWLAGAAAVVVGPGLGAGDATAALVAQVFAQVRGGAPVVLDADAIHVLAPPPSEVPPAVWTPHPGEAARLLGCSAREVQADREAAVAALVARVGGVVVLKGAGTLVADGDRCFVNTTGNAGMATGGSGDVLAGLLGALLAQGMAPFEAACLAVHVHGAAGDRVARRLSRTGLVASDLPRAIAAVLGEVEA